MNEISIIPIKGLPEVKKGDDLATMTFDIINKSGNVIKDSDVFVITQKIVSKSEGMERDLNEYEFEDLIKSETKQIIRKRGDLIIAKTKHGFICANAGIDKSNIEKNKALLLPEDPNKSAHKFRSQIETASGKRVAVVISDTFGRAWRKGQVNFAIGSSGISPITNYIGKYDSFKNELFATEIATIDEIASAAELVMGKTNMMPVAIVKGYQYDKNNDSISNIIREKDFDLFR